ncbi:hypothetical protein SLEP1_g2815 [Rubroshorea leprosula]|uniref:Wax synthase domain-containing protein n=1 Tax=Rubroshorea leprosula TaxID=152421 RepID=A0AAV5HPD3_9ROSI|nr:hypothetical protein SLEP1_g2815 [Rubroshorea leprosula]
MERETLSFMKVWLSVIASLCYCYAIGRKVPQGTKRLICFLPIICLFLFLPLNLSSPHLGGVTGFFIAWLANFKLLLFAFGKGPLTSYLSFPLFIAVSCFPIKVQQNPSPKSQPNGDGRKKSNQNGQNLNKEGPLNYALKGILLAILVRIYDYSEYMHPKLILLLYAFHIYFLLELILAISATLVRALLGLELEPQFNEPYLATSLQDFWGKRWNLMVTSILRPTVYEPTLKIASKIIGRKWAPLPAVFSTFLVSAVMHELIFYYLGRLRPNWEITWFFLIHGFCLTLEIALKKAIAGKLRFPWVVSGPLTTAFVMSTGCWLFFPQFTRCKIDERAFEEYAALGAFLKNFWPECLGISSF